MIFDSLKEKMEYFRSLYDYKLTPGGYTLVMIDGHNFSRKIKKRFKRPFDEKFIEYMNKTAIHICKEFQGIKFAYTQSDEISFLMTDFDGEKVSDPSYGYRLCKLQSLIASEASGYFTKLMMETILESKENIQEKFNDIFKGGLFTFDCKVWQVPSEGDVNGWFVYRQNDCITNSVSQVGQYYFSHKELLGINTSQIVEKLIKNKGVSWENDFSDGMKYGRLIYKEDETKYNENGEPFIRGVWISHDVPTKFSGTDIIKKLIPSR